MIFSTIVWDVNPEFLPGIFENLPIHPRWYGLLFATAFWIGFKLVEKIFIHEKVDLKWADSLFITILFGTVVGARLGHVFFYGWEYYSQYPGDIIKIWEGGLASHGAVIGVVVAIWIWSKRVSHKPMLWALDRIVMSMTFGGSLVRLGNFFNSEIVGIPTDLPWGVRFVRLGEDFARHPAQLYEAVAYMIAFGLMYHAYWKYGKGKYQGYITGMFMVLVFGFRFFVEFFKENQEAFEQGMVLNMGQILSIPVVVIGVYVIWRAGKSAPSTE